MEVYVVGKQWMWKAQHMDGAARNQRAARAGRAAGQADMGSEDVLHSFYIPAFRVKADVIPGRYNVLWFTATKPGKYHLFCAEYCGTKHSGMIGWVYAMEPSEFQAWLGGGNAHVIAGGRRREAVPGFRLHQLPSGRRAGARRRS